MEVIRGSPGIIRIVALGGRPHPIPDKEIEALQQIDRSKREHSAFHYLNVGQKVLVISGPLTDISGTIMRFKNHDRLVISIDVIMKSVSVEIDQSEVVCFKLRHDNERSDDALQPREATQNFSS